MKSGLLLWCASLGFATLAQAAGAAGGNRVTLGVVNWIGYGPIYCAAAHGDYLRYGPDVKLVTFSDNSLMSGALAGGELDASTLTYDQVLIADARGWNLKVVMAVDYSVGGDAIVAGEAVQTLEQLKGRRVAFQPLSPSDFLLAYALGRAGLTEKDIRPINATPEGVPGVLASGTVDAGVTYEPSVSVILKLGGGHQFHVLLSSREARGMITDVLAVTANTIAKRPQLVEQLIRGTLDGLAFMSREPDQAAVLIGRTLGITPEEVKRQLPNIENPPLARAADVFRPGASLPSFHASGAIIGRVLARQGQLRELPLIESTYDARFVDSLQARAGVPK
jgi:NitT/TauT family transport system substrate-binding protein